MVLILFNTTNNENLIKKIISITEEVLQTKIDDKEKFSKKLVDSKEYSTEKENFGLRLFGPREVSGKRFHLMSINLNHNHVKGADELNKLIELSIRLCKELDIIQVVDNHFIDKNNSLGRIHINYLNEPLTEMEKKQKMHYLSYFDNIIAYKKLLINDNPFLVFIENSTRGRGDKDYILKHEQGFPLDVKFLTSNKEYDKQSVHITSFTKKDSKKEFQIKIGKPPSTFFFYEYYSQDGNLSKALEHIERKFADRGYELIMEKERILFEFR